MFKSKEVQQFLQSGVSGTHTDLRYTQRGLSKDGCMYVVKEIQRTMELHDVLYGTA